jgi:hypothetical protein
MNDIPSTWKTASTSRGGGNQYRFNPLRFELSAQKCEPPHLYCRRDGVTSFTDLEIKWIYDKTHEQSSGLLRHCLMNNYQYLLGSVKDMTYLRDTPSRRSAQGSGLPGI